MNILKKSVMIAGFGLAVSAMAASVRAETPAPIDLGGRTITRMATDLQRPYVYALSPKMGTEQEARLLFINTDTHTLEKSIPIGPNPTDMTVHYPDGYLYVVGPDEEYIRRVNLATRSQDTPVTVTTQEGFDRVNAGPAGKVYIEEWDQWINLYVIDTSDGATLSQLSLYEGDGETDATGTIYYHCEDNSSAARITKYDFSGDTPIALARSPIHEFGSRSLLLSANGERLFWQGYIYNKDLIELGKLAEPVFAATVDGRVAFGAGGYYNVATQQKMGTLPATSTVMAVDNTETYLVYYNNQTNEVQFLDLVALTGMTLDPLNPQPADGSTVILPLAGVRWNHLAYASSWDVYLGTDPVAVANADRNSPEYKGTDSTNAYTFPTPLHTGQTYYWRLDSQTQSGLVKGKVWSFTTAPLRMTPNRMDLTRIRDSIPFSRDIVVDSDAPGLPWSVEESIPWLDAIPMDPTTSSVLSLVIDPAGLGVGDYNGSIQITAGGTSFDYPVTLRILDLNLTKLKCDRSRPLAYGLQPGSGPLDPGKLVFIESDTGLVEDLVDVGDNPTDLDLDPSGDSVWVINFGSNDLMKVGIESRTVEERYTPTLPADHSQGQHYHVVAGANHRLYIVDAEWAPGLSVFDTTPGVEKVIKSVTSEAIGGLAISPDGNTLYAWQQTGWGAGYAYSHLFSIDARNDSLSTLRMGTYTFNRDPLDSPIFVADQGRDVFLKLYCFSSNDFSTPTATFPSQIYQVPEHGGFVVTNSTLYDTTDQSAILSLPVQSTVMDFTADDETLLLFDGTNHKIVRLQPRRTFVLNLLLGRSDYSRPYMDHNGDSTIDAGDIF